MYTLWAGAWRGEVHYEHSSLLLSAYYILGTVLRV